MLILYIGSFKGSKQQEAKLCTEQIQTTILPILKTYT